jgi:hypothetical protein
VLITIDSKWNLTDAISTVVLAVNNKLEDMTNTFDVQYYKTWWRLGYEYNIDTNELNLFWVTLDDTNQYGIEFRMDRLDFGFSQLINQNPRINTATLHFDEAADVIIHTWTFKNVWNREDLFIHASFVTYTAFQYLGRNGEFYTKPSKIYDFNFGQQQFYFQLSFDGASYKPLYYENFIVELSLLLDAKNYQSA